MASRRKRCDVAEAESTGAPELMVSDYRLVEGDRLERCADGRSIRRAWLYAIARGLYGRVGRPCVSGRRTDQEVFRSHSVVMFVRDLRGALSDIVWGETVDASSCEGAPWRFEADLAFELKSVSFP